MREVLSYRDISYITSLIDEVITDEPKSVSQYELLIDMLLASSNSHIDDQDSDNSLLRESLISLNTKLLAGISEKCNVFDEADPLDCFNPKYSINVAPCFKDYAELMISVLVTETLQLGEGTIDVKYSGHYIKRDFATVLGRFLFLYNGYTDLEYNREESNYPNIFPLIIYHSIFCPGKQPRKSCLSGKLPQQTCLPRVLYLSNKSDSICIAEHFGPFYWTNYIVSFDHQTKPRRNTI